jgi:hypothetical protein
VSNVGLLPPLGYVLRARLFERWIRIHALPAPGRYARDESETRIARARHFAAASAALGIGAECLAFATTWAGESFAGRWEPCRVPDELRSDPDTSENLRGSASHYRRMVWGLGDAEEIVRRISRDEYGGRVAILSLGTGAVHCPYDGGADFLMRTPTCLATMRMLFADWAPDVPEGPSSSV